MTSGMPVETVPYGPCLTAPASVPFVSQPSALRSSVFHSLHYRSLRSRAAGAEGKEATKGRGVWSE